MALTHTVIRQARPKAKAYILNDIEGLSLYVASNGSKYWHFRFSWRGRQQRISFGNYPEISLKDARELRDKARSQVAKGIDPRDQREETKPMQSAPGVPTFAEFAERWKDFKLKQLKARLLPAAQNKRNGRQGTKEQIERYLRLDMLPLLGHLPMTHISRRDVLAVQAKIEARGSCSIAEKVRSWLNELFRYAVALEVIPINPAADMDIVALPAGPVQHNPYLTMAEMPELMAKLANYQGARQTVLGLRLLLLTGVRTGELRYAEPHQFDLKAAIWRIPPEEVKQLQRQVRTKNGKIPPYLVPLSRQAVAIIEELLAYRSPAQRYLLCHCSEPLVPISENTLNGALKRMGYKDRLTGHGIRATLSTALNELRYDKDLVEAQLSHADKDAVRDTYNHAKYVEERRKMMQDWADRLDEWEREGLRRLRQQA